MPSDLDIQRFMERKKLEAIEARKPHLQAMVADGRRIQTVIDHPGWQMYVTELETRVGTLRKRREAMAEQMTGDDIVGAELEKLKVQVVRLDGEIKGLKSAVDLVPQVLQQATQAAEALDRLSPQS